MSEREILKELVKHTFMALVAIDAVMDKYGLVELDDIDRIRFSGEIDKIYTLYRKVIKD